MYLDAAVAELAVRTVERGRSAPRGTKKLSRREEEVLRMVAWGQLSREIADRLQISIKTVETHKANAMHKLELANRIDVVRYALLQGWLHET
jgi:DNA-binding NarL/FixJ family response regulator